MHNLDYDLNQFRFVILPGAYPSPGFQHYYNTAYKCWRNVWEEAYCELNLKTKLYSDDFTRQTEIGCVFYGLECVGMLFFNYADFSFCDFKNDSYFKKWTEEDIQKLTSRGPRVIICSNTTLAKNWRKTKMGLSMKDLLLYMLCKRFKHSAADAMTGVTRRSRGIHKLTYRFGAVPIREDIPNFNKDDRVDLCAFFKDTVSEGEDDNIIRLGRRMWESRTIVPRVIYTLPEENSEPFIKKKYSKTAA